MAADPAHATLRGMDLRRLGRDSLAALPLPEAMRRPPRFVILGTGRSGTGYISKTLTAAGIRTGHEDWWNPHNRRVPFLLGDSSWIAVFQANHYPGRVFHQVRNPIEVISSLVSVDLAPPRRDKEWAQLRESILGGFTDDPLLDAMRIFDLWFSRAEEEAEWTWRLEDVDEALIHEIAERLGIRLDTNRVRRALTKTRRDVNSKEGSDKRSVALSLEDLPDGSLKRRIVTHARRYGYV